MLAETFDAFEYREPTSKHFSQQIKKKFKNRSDTTNRRRRKTQKKRVIRSQRAKAVNAIEDKISGDRDNLKLIQTHYRNGMDMVSHEPAYEDYFDLELHEAIFLSLNDNDTHSSANCDDRMTLDQFIAPFVHEANIPAKRDSYMNTHTYTDWSEDLGDPFTQDLDETMQLALLQSYGDTSEDHKCDDSQSVVCLMKGRFGRHVTRKHTRTRTRKRRKRKGKSKIGKNRISEDFDTYWKSAQEFHAYLAQIRPRGEAKERSEEQMMRDCSHPWLKNLKNVAFQSALAVWKHPKLRSVLPSPAFISRRIEDCYPGSTYHIESLCTLPVVNRFVKSFLPNHFCSIAFHGTSCSNNTGIKRLGLVPGGTRGVRVAHGSAYGRGVYCSPNLTTANGYARGSIFVCLVNTSRTNHTRNSNIWVVPHEQYILPVYLITTYSGFSGCTYGPSGGNPLANQIIAFITRFKPHNLPQKHRAKQRKWPSNKY